MEFTVRKGLDTALKVHGMYTHYFSVYCVVLGGLVILAVGVLMNTMSGGGSFLSFVLSLVACGGIAIFTRVYLVNRSSEKKYGKFSKTVYVISNKDLLQNI